MKEAVAILLAYLWGAVPTAYLVARYLRGIDIRRFGSGNVGASNAVAHVGLRTGLAIGTFDCLAKGTLSVVLAGFLGLSLGGQGTVGLAVVAGHNWSLYLGFTGGRGVATAVGTLVAFQMWGGLLILAALGGLVGRLLMKDTALWTGIGVAVMPLWAFLLRQPQEMLFYTLALAVLLALKRLSANWRRPPQGHPLGRVLWRRLLFDRDVRSREEWVLQAPSHGPTRPGGP